MRASTRLKVAVGVTFAVFVCATGFALHGSKFFPVIAQPIEHPWRFAFGLYFVIGSSLSCTSCYAVDGGGAIIRRQQTKRLGGLASALVPVLTTPFFSSSPSCCGPSGFLAYGHLPVTMRVKRKTP